MTLPFTLPDFTRIIWHSALARDVWAPRLARINQAWGQIERTAVEHGQRAACLTFVDAHHLPEVSCWAAKRGLIVLPLATNGIGAQYSSTAQPVVAGQPFQYRIVLTRPELVAGWAEAWSGAGGLDNSTIGRLLGYPECCREFFERVWVRDQSVDTSWEMALGSDGIALHAGLSRKGGTIRVPAVGGQPCDPANNILLRWLGVRLVPHLPCSFSCTPTWFQARDYAQLGRAIGFNEEVDWIMEMLSWPLEWSALHGIAEIRTPILTISTRTTATGAKHVVQLDGATYPDEGAQGLRFPFRVVKGKVTEKPAFQRAQVPVWELNGFSTEAGMNAAHDALLACLPSETGTFLDMGAGTGRLLERASAAGWSVAGVELDNTRAGAGRLPITRGDMFATSLWDQREYDVVAVMPGRLLEQQNNPAKQRVFRRALWKSARSVLLYAYGDWLHKFGGLGPLAAEAGLGDGAVIKRAQADGVEAALVVFPPMEDAHEFESSQSQGRTESP